MLGVGCIPLSSCRSPAFDDLWPFPVLGELFLVLGVVPGHVLAVLLRRSSLTLAALSFACIGLVLGATCGGVLRLPSHAASLLPLPIKAMTESRPGAGSWRSA